MLILRPKKVRRLRSLMMMTSFDSKGTRSGTRSELNAATLLTVFAELRAGSAVDDAEYLLLPYNCTLSAEHPFPTIGWMEAASWRKEYPLR